MDFASFTTPDEAEALYTEAYGRGSGKRLMTREFVVWVTKRESTSAVAGSCLLSALKRILRQDFWKVGIWPADPDPGWFHN